MACFVAPAGVAVVTTVARKIVQKREKAAAEQQKNGRTEGVHTPGRWTRRLGWLNTMLWGGTLMLILDHLLSGELVPWPPFLTALETPDLIGPMLREIAVVGGSMTAAVFAAWTIMVVWDESRARTKAKRPSEA